MKVNKEWILFIVFVVLFGVMSLAAPNFLSLLNIENMLSQLPEFALITLGQMVVILTAGIDLSITYLASFSGIVTVAMLNAHQGIVISILVGLGVALLCGVLNGWVIAYVGVSPILATLGTMSLFEGLGQLVTSGRPISGFPQSYGMIGNGSIGPVPYSMLIFAAMLALSAVLLNGTRWGRSVYMVGSNPVATLFSGIRTRRVLLWVYVFSALMAGLAAIIMTSRYNSASYDLGNSYLLQSISAVVLGGVSISGGYGKLSGVMLGVFIFEVLSDGLQLIGVPQAMVDVLMGAILILVLLLNFVASRRNQRRVRQSADRNEPGVPTVA
ncbi:MAG: ABC transporter permease [Alicyclobacillus sp.]|nr:ABC transporter permease [Alicyclobacillus sp.]